MSDAIAFLSRAIEQGQGLAKADIVLKGGRIFDLVSGELIAGDVAICNDRIVGTLGEYSGAHEIDVRGKIVVPGFIDTHCHVESSLITPLEFDRCVLAHGVTTAICDPHEIGNVLGQAGLRYFLDGAMATAMDLRVQLSSCVPATDLETAGARLEVGDLIELADHPKVLGLAEFMNFPGLLARDPACLAKLAAFQTRPIDGHSPLLGGYRLNGYLSAGVRTDHEVTNLPEGAREAREGHGGADPRGLGVQGPACAQLLDHRAQFAVHRLLHRRPQSARHRRGGPPGLPDPHRDPARRAAARGLSRRVHIGRAHLRPARPRPRRARLARRPRRRRRSRSPARSRRCSRPAASSTTRCSPRAARWRRSGATASRRARSGRRISSPAGRGPRPRRSASFRARSSPSGSR